MYADREYEQEDVIRIRNRTFYEGDGDVNRRIRALVTKILNVQYVCFSAVENFITMKEYCEDARVKLANKNFRALNGYYMIRYKEIMKKVRGIIIDISRHYPNVDVKEILHGIRELHDENGGSMIFDDMVWEQLVNPKRPLPTLKFNDDHVYICTCIGEREDYKIPYDINFPVCRKIGKLSSQSAMMERYRECVNDFVTIDTALLWIMYIAENSFIPKFKETLNPDYVNYKKVMAYPFHMALMQISHDIAILALNDLEIRRRYDNEFREREEKSSYIKYRDDMNIIWR